jgi:diacylglycerol O-acyltransferase
METPTPQKGPTTASISSLHALDAEFLLIEDDDSPMYIGSLCVFEGPVPSRTECERFVASRLDAIPMYRKRLRAVPFGLGRPVLVDDPSFDLTYHLRRTSLTAPYDEAALWRLMGTLMSSALDRAKPLWQLFVVDGLPDGRWALITKVHHALIDGVAGIGVLAAVLSDRPEAPPIEPSAWTPASEPTRATLVANAFGGLRRDASVWSRDLLSAARNPRATFEHNRDVGAGLYAFARRLLGRKTSSLQGGVHGRRRYATVRVQLEDVRQIRSAFHCTVNDVLLTLLSGGYRAMLELRGDDLRRVRLHSLVPVSVRARDEHGVEGNRVSAVLCELPVGVDDPRARLDAMIRRMHQAKGSHMVEAGVWFTDIGDLAPPLVVRAISRAVVHAMHWMPQTAFGTVTTNVPGPALPLYFRGRRMLSWSPYVPITQGARIGTAVLSYNGALAFGITADYQSVQYLEVFARAIESDLAILLGRAHATEAGEERP